MDAIVLAPMPQSPVQSPGQSGQPTGRNDSSFGPVLSRAINGNSSSQRSSAAGASRDTAAADTEQLIDIEQIDDPGELEAFLAANDLTFDTLPPELQVLIAAAFPAFASGAGGTASGETGMLPPGMTHFPHDLLPRGMEKFVESLVNSEDLQTRQPAGLVAQKQELTLILAQLQQIISANETSGAVVEQVPADAVTLDDVAALTMRLPAAEGSPRAAMTAALAQQNGTQEQGNQQNTAAAASLPTAETVQTASRQPLPPGQTADGEAAATGPSTTLRQDMQPVTDARTMSTTNDNEQNAQQNAQQDSNQTGQPAAAAASSTAGSQSDQPVQNGIFSTSLQQSSTTQQAQGQSGSVTLPSGTTVNEQDVISQIVQRFQMTTRLQSTKINLRLHPAELGELKIDLIVREGTIKASVFAQNQHAHEILERNMPKLRSTLEQHGFTIDELVVSFRSETTREFDLFDGNSARSQQFTFSDTPRSHLATFEAVLDTSLAGTDLADSGLSIRA
jgi:flagellar hook-length control protein FliK